MLTVTSSTESNKGNILSHGTYQMPISIAWCQAPNKVKSRDFNFEHSAIGTVRYSEKAQFANGRLKDLTVDARGPKVGHISYRIKDRATTSVDSYDEGGLWLIPEMAAPDSGVKRIEPLEDKAGNISSGYLISAVSKYCRTHFDLYDNPIANWRVYYSDLNVTGSWNTTYSRFDSGSRSWNAQATSPIHNWTKTGDGSSATNKTSYVEGQGWANFYGVFPLGSYTQWIGMSSHYTKLYGGGASFARLSNTILAYNQSQYTWVTWKDKTYVNGDVSTNSTTTKKDYIVSY